MKIRKVKMDELARIYELVTDIGILDLHHPYTYWVIFSSSPDLFYVAEHDDQIIGFVCGLENYRGSDTAFLWQIGVLPAFRRQGIGLALLQKFMDELKKRGKKALSYTITGDNQASLSLFSSFWKDRGLKAESQGDTGSPIADMKPEIIFTAELI